MGGVLIATRAGVNADAPPLRRREPFYHAVVELDEGPEELLRGVELHRESAFRKVDLYLGRTFGQALTDVRLGFANEVVEERVSRIARDPVLRIQQAQRRGRDDRLLNRNAGVLLGLFQVANGVRPISEGTCGQPREPPRVTIGERDGDAVRRKRLEPLDRIRGKTGFGLFSVGDDRRPGSLEALDGVPDRPVLQRPKLLEGDSAGRKLPHSGDQLRRPRNATNRLGGNRHAPNPIGGSRRLSNETGVVKNVPS